ncbi:MAG TPA: hypothetical protein VHN80_13810 [Kineosporiaceae bacterium]|nr:hypothetical protein [Kineosporiaceae bacterium]
MTEFRNHIHNRIAETREHLRLAHEADEPYLVEVRLGELESLARLAADHGLVVEGVSESLAEYGPAIPAGGLPTVLDLNHLHRPVHSGPAPQPSDQ